MGELKNGHISEYTIHPEDFGLPMASTRALRVDNPAQSQAMLQGVLANQPGPARDIVLLNAGAALYAAQVAESIEAGIALAIAAIASGAAQDRLMQLIAFSQKG